MRVRFLNRPTALLTPFAGSSDGDFKEEGYCPQYHHCGFGYRCNPASFPSHCPRSYSCIGYAHCSAQCQYFGLASPTTAQHVVEDLFGKVDIIIDGGSTEVGLESTVVDMSGKSPILLRPGGITSVNSCRKS